MHIRTTLSDGAPVILIVRFETVCRLWSTCFRGKEARLAGNFSRWENAEEVFNDPVLRELFLTHVLASTENRGTTSFHVTVDYGEDVGWNSTAPQSDYRTEDLEPFAPNRKSTTRALKLGSGHLAPVTQKVTVRYELRCESRSWTVVIWSVYPGEYIGDLRGDITKRTGRVFFRFSHPGA